MIYTIILLTNTVGMMKLVLVSPQCHNICNVFGKWSIHIVIHRKYQTAAVTDIYS